MPSIIFIRHGESESNHNLTKNKVKDDYLGDPALTETGKIQAAQTANCLLSLMAKNGYPNVKVMTSVFTRAKSTADPFLKAYSGVSKVIHTPLLNEYTGTHKVLTEDHVKAGITNDDNWNSFTDRIMQFINMIESDLVHDNDMMENEYDVDADRLKRFHESTPIIVFGHSLFISVLINYLATQRKTIAGKNSIIFRFPNCSITHFEINGKSDKIFTVANINHLDEEIRTGVDSFYI